jgi:hypothetical protein
MVGIQSVEIAVIGLKDQKLIVIFVHNVERKLIGKIGDNMEFKEKVYTVLVSLGKFMVDSENIRFEIQKTKDGVLTLSEFFGQKETDENVKNIEKIVGTTFNTVLKNINGILDEADLENIAIDSGLLKLL